MQFLRNDSLFVLLFVLPADLLLSGPYDEDYEISRNDFQHGWELVASELAAAKTAHVKAVSLNDELMIGCWPLTANFEGESNLKKAQLQKPPSMTSMPMIGENVGFVCDSGACAASLNGIYRMTSAADGDGYLLMTPDLGRLNNTAFHVQLDICPAADEASYWILVGGSAYRWFGLQVNRPGILSRLTRTLTPS